MSTNEIEGQQKEETAEIKKSIIIDATPEDLDLMKRLKSIMKVGLIS
jgi:hypothetical protein